MPPAEAPTQNCGSPNEAEPQDKQPKPYVQLALFEMSASKPVSTNTTESGEAKATEKGSKYEESDSDPPVYRPPLPWDDSHWNVR